MNVATMPEAIAASALRAVVKRAEGIRRRHLLALQRCGRSEFSAKRRDHLKVCLARAEDALLEVQQLHAQFERMERTLKFYARREHWLTISTDAPHDQVLIAVGGHGSPNGWSEAHAALQGIDP